MDVLNKTIKKLSEEEYQALIMQVSGKKKNKPYVVLETTRNRDVADSEMMEMLQVNASTYYTLKSRLNSKIAAILSKNMQNPISSLIDEVTRVPANLYGNNKDFSIRALKELEKQLIEYDLSAELIVVYKTLAQLHLYNEDHTYYDKLYKKHVAFSLAKNCDYIIYDDATHELFQCLGFLFITQLILRQYKQWSDLYFRQCGKQIAK